MNKCRRGRALRALLFLCAVFAAAPALGASGPVVTRRVRPETTRDAALEAAIRAALYGEEGRGAGERGVRYYYNRVDLDGDGRPEALAYVFGTAWCGSAGCALLVFKDSGGRYELMSHVSGAENPVVVSTRSTNGWRDLIAHVRWGEVGGRTLRDYYAVLRFDGRTYPEQFPGSPPLGDAERASGAAYLTGDQSARSGLALRPAGREKRRARRAPAKRPAR